MSYQPLRRSKQTNVEINEIKYTPQHRPPERSPTLSSKNKSGILWRKLKSPCINAFRYLDERLAEHFPGWKRGAIIFIILAVISTVINLGLTIWAVSTHKTSPEGLGILYHGDCHRATWWSRFAHALINILSAALLIGSNFFMQLLASPTREHVDMAHRRGEWADIGIPSFRNSWRRIISTKRTFLWLMTGLASIPLNLLWNATVFHAPSAYEYYPIAVSEGFLEGQWFTDPLPVTGLTDSGNQIYLPGNDIRQIAGDLGNSTAYAKMTSKECLEAYTQDYLYDRSDVILVTAWASSDNGINGTCPFADKQLYRTLNGRKWWLYCGQDMQGFTLDLPLPQDRTGQSVTECADLCAQTSGCVASYWTANYTAPNCNLSSSIPITGPVDEVNNYQWSVLAEDSADEGFNSSVIGTTLNGFWPGPYRWLCPEDLGGWDFDCRQEVLRNPNDWHLAYYNRPLVKSCYSRVMEQRCRVGFSLDILLVVLVFNFVKIGCFVWTYLHFRHRTNDGVKQVLFTTGDAIASFLREEDPETRGICLAEKSDFENGLWDQRWVVPKAMKWRPVPHFSWFRTIGLWRWVYHVSQLLVSALLPIIYLVARRGYLYGTLGMNMKHTTQLGMGNPSGLFLFGKPSVPSQQRSMILANLPQLLLSYVYFTYTKHLTCMIAAQEYNQFAKSKKGLRVSQPIDNTAQRSTYFLGMPLSYAVPFFAVQTTLHYLASQAVFLAKVDMLDHVGNSDNVNTLSLNQVGFSVMGMISFAGVAFLAACTAFFLGLKRLPEEMPSAASCSATISAASHPATDKSVDLEEIRWGVDGGDHCSLTSEPIERPIQGRKYA